MSKYLGLAKDTIIFGIGNFTTKLIYFFLMPIYTGALSPYDFGLADLLNNTLQLAIPILTLSISDAVFRFTLDKDSNPRLLLAHGLKILGYSYILIAIGLIVIYSLRLPEYWSIFCILYITESLKTLFAQFIRGIGKTKEYAANGIIAAFVLLATTFVFLKWLNLGITGYLWAFVVANTAALIYLIFVVGAWKFIDIRAHDKRILKEMLIFCIPLTPNMLSWWVTNLSSRYIVAYYCGLSLSGLFAAASKLPALMNVLASIFQLSWQSASVKEYNESKTSSFYTTVFKFYSFGIFFFGSVAIALIQYISIPILKGSFYQAWTYSPLLIFSSMIGCISIFLGTFYSVTKENWKGMKNTVIGALLNIILNFALIPFTGVYGALIANVCSYVLIVWLRWNDSIKYVRIEVKKIKFLSACGLILIQAILMTLNYGYLEYLGLLMPFAITGLYFKEITELQTSVCRLIKERIHTKNNV